MRPALCCAGLAHSSFWNCHGFSFLKLIFRILQFFGFKFLKICFFALFHSLFSSFIFAFLTIKIATQKALKLANAKLDQINLSAIKLHRVAELVLLVLKDAIA